MNTMKKISETIHTVVFEDKENEVYTIMPLSAGGPIISALTFEDAEKKFKKALQLSIAIRNFFYFINTQKSNE